MEKCKYSGGIVMESEGSLGQCGMPPQLTVSGMQLQLRAQKLIGIGIYICTIAQCNVTKYMMSGNHTSFQALQATALLCSILPFNGL